MKTRSFFRFRSQWTPRCGGFTLIEMITVCVIIVILASFVLSAIQRARKQAKWTQCKSVATELAVAIRNYHHEYEQWPCPPAFQDGEHIWSNDNDVVINYLLPNATTPDGKIQNDKGFWTTAGVASNLWDIPYLIHITATGTLNEVIVTNSTVNPP